MASDSRRRTERAVYERVGAATEIVSSFEADATSKEFDIHPALELSLSFRPEISVSERRLAKAALRPAVDESRQGLKRLEGRHGRRLDPRRAVCRPQTQAGDADVVREK